MTAHEIFEKNIALLKIKNPLIAYHLELVHQSDRIQFCKTQQQEPNLCQKRFGITDYYHAQAGALQEAQEIVNTELEPTTQILYFYGLGLAYIYEALSAWLKQDSSRHLILLEDDVEVIYYFLHTERATKILQDAQVTLLFFQGVHADADKFFELISRFLHARLQFLALPYYISKKEKQAFDVCYRLLYDQSWITLLHNEFLSGQEGYLANFYPNFLRLSNSYLANDLFKKFTNVPAIICGAGPSLEKNIDLLKTLSDRALIFAGGSSLNVVNAYGIQPHFGAGIDPNTEQYHRWLTNDSFTLPVFYRNRLSHRAFNLIQGPKLYVPGAHHALPAWFEDKLKLKSPPLDEGHNVINFCTEIAYAMGCDPIIYVGMDLAFTKIKTYASGIKTHPTRLGRSDPYAQQDKTVVSRTGIDGQPITTKWEWLTEANWVGHYKLSHPTLQMINATEGGVGFCHVPNMSLKEVAERYLTQSYDFTTRVHGEIQNARATFRHDEVIRDVLELKQSLTTCIEYCSQFIDEENKQLERLPLPTSPYSSKAILYESLLQDEGGYQGFLKEFDLHRIALDRFKGQKLPMEGQIHELIERYQFLRAVLTQHLNIIQQSITQFIFSFSPTIVIKNAALTLKRHGRYEFTKDHLIIEDAELLIDQKVDAVCSREFYDSGQLKWEFFRDAQGFLQGPSRFYSEQNLLLAENWFYKGKKQGQSHTFYHSGALYAVENYKDDRYHGKQEFFFQNSRLHMRFFYQNGLLEGPVSIYNSNGILERELHYHAGQRHGVERSWNSNGKLLMECQYEQGLPVGATREWDNKGLLRTHVAIHTYPDDFDLKHWNAQGEIERSFQHGKEEFEFYYLQKKDQIELLSNALRSLQERVTTILEQGETGTVPLSTEAKQELETAQASIVRLQVMEAELKRMQADHLKHKDAS